MKRLNCHGCTAEDYLFVHTDSHKEFMEILLEKRKRLESEITAKLKERNRQPLEGGATVMCVDMAMSHVMELQPVGGGVIVCNK